MLAMILSLVFSLISCAYGDTWKNDVITVSIFDNNHNTESRINSIEYVITGENIHKERFAGWNQALNTLNGTAPQFKLVKNYGDIQIKLINYKSAKKYSADTKLESKYPGITSKGTITIYSIDDLSAQELQMLMRHELGHALGLEHSQDPTDLMYKVIPYYTSYISKTNLIDIQSMYN